MFIKCLKSLWLKIFVKSGAGQSDHRSAGDTVILISKVMSKVGRLEHNPSHFRLDLEQKEKSSSDSEEKKKKKKWHPFCVIAAQPKTSSYNTRISISHTVSFQRDQKPESLNPHHPLTATVVMVTIWKARPWLSPARERSGHRENFRH